MRLIIGTDRDDLFSNDDLIVRSAAQSDSLQAAASDPPHVRYDYNGDGRSDILWVDFNGNYGQWLADPDGTFTWNPAALYFEGGRFVEEVGDFDGDGRADILWRDPSNVFTEWLAQPDGSFMPAAVEYHLPPTWIVEGVGDFDGDGHADILWSDYSTPLKTYSTWNGQDGGIFTANTAVYNLFEGPFVERIGDFDGDGRDDILWRDTSGTVAEWLGQQDGSFAWNPDAMYHQPGWAVQAGDYNGDGRDDILWRDLPSGQTDGSLWQWLGQPDGTFVPNPASTYSVPNSLSIESSGDFNGDGRDDIIWLSLNYPSRDALVQWLGQPDGSFAWNPAAVYELPGPGTAWTLLPLQSL